MNRRRNPPSDCTARGQRRLWSDRGTLLGGPPAAAVSTPFWHPQRV